MIDTYRASEYVSPTRKLRAGTQACRADYLADCDIAVREANEKNQRIAVLWLKALNGGSLSRGENYTLATVLGRLFIRKRLNSGKYWSRYTTRRLQELEDQRIALDEIRAMEEEFRQTKTKEKHGEETAA